MIAIGIDPDTTTTGIGTVQKIGKEFRAIDVRLARAKGRKTTDRRNAMAYDIYTELEALRDILPGWPVAVTIEWQKLRPKGEKRPNNIVDLCGISGMCLLAAVAVFGERTQVFSPIPSEWKGGVPKDIHNNRTRGKLRLTEDLEYRDEDGLVPGASRIAPSLRSHPVDGLGMAIWTLDDYGPLYDARIKAEAAARARARK